MVACDGMRNEMICCLVSSPSLRCPLLSPTTATVTVVACDETAVMAGINVLSNDEDKSSTIPKQTDVTLLYDVMYDASVILLFHSYFLL